MSDQGTRWRWLLVALVAAVGGALVAPRPWPAGPGRLEVTHGGVTLERAVEIGSVAPVTLEGPGVRVDLPGGVPVQRPVEARLSFAGRSEPALDEATVHLVLPDGRRELVPVMRRKGAVLEAARRPPVHAGTVLGVLGLVVVLWVSEAIPLFVTSLLVPVVIVMAGAGSARTALAPFFDPIIALFFGGFLMAEAMQRTGLDRRLAVSLVARSGRGPVTLFGALLGVSAFLSMWMSNTASTALLVPIALAVTAPLENHAYRKAVVLGIAYAATIGGVGSAIGTPANPLAMKFLGEFAGRPITFAGWFAYGLPLVFVLLPVMGIYLWRRSGVVMPRETFVKARAVAAGELASLGRLDRGQWSVIAVFLGVIALWLTQTFHGINSGIIAVAGAVALALLGKVKAEDLGRISWAALLTFGGGLALGTFLVESGGSDWLATRLAGLSGLPAWLGVAVVALITLGLTAVASNTATAAMLVPLAIPLAAVLGVDPVLLVCVVAIASSIDFALVIGTPPTMIAYSTRLYTTREIFRTGIVLDLVGIGLLVTAVVGLWRLFGVV